MNLFPTKETPLPSTSPALGPQLTPRCHNLGIAALRAFAGRTISHSLQACDKAVSECRFLIIVRASGAATVTGPSLPLSCPPHFQKMGRNGEAGRAGAGRAGSLSSPPALPAAESDWQSIAGRGWWPGPARAQGPAAWPLARPRVPSPAPPSLQLGCKSQP